MFDTPGFCRIMPHNKLVLKKKIIHFVDNNELGQNYDRLAKINPINKYLDAGLQDLLTLTFQLMKRCSFGKEKLVENRLFRANILESISSHMYLLTQTLNITGILSCI